MRGALSLALMAFAVTLVVRFPARWAAPLLPRGLHCEALNGSLWSGSCSGLSRGGSALGDASWSVELLPLLSAHLGVHLDLSGPGGFARGELILGFGGALKARDLQLDLPLSSALVSSFPAGAHAHLQGTVARLDWSGKYLAALQGELAVQNLVGAQGQSLGNYQVSFAPVTGADLPVGEVHDAGGPLRMAAVLQLTRDPGYLLKGRIAPRPSATPDITEMLQYLGPPDASGQRDFAVQGLF